MLCLGAPNGRASYRIPAERVMETAGDLDSSAMQAILIPDTAIAMFQAASQLEESLGKPVVSSNQATLWDVLRQAGSRPEAPRVRPAAGRPLGRGVTGEHRSYWKPGMISLAKVRIIVKYEDSSAAKQRRFMASTPAFR